MNQRTICSIFTEVPTHTRWGHIIHPKDYHPVHALMQRNLTNAESAWLILYGICDPDTTTLVRREFHLFFTGERFDLADIRDLRYFQSILYDNHCCHLYLSVTTTPTTP